jgi:hypothetical protein
VHAALGLAGFFVIRRDRERLAAAGCAQLGQRRVRRRSARPVRDRDAVAPLREYARNASC